MSETDECRSRVDDILNEKWDIRKGDVVPETEDVKLAGGGVKFDGVVLYADLKSSSRLATISPPETVAKIVRAYLHLMCRLISLHEGSITSFDGDRVMAIFLGERMNSRAAICALKMNYVLKEILAPTATSNFKSIRDAGFIVSHAVGVDRSPLLGVRAGQRGSNDLVWVGRAPNFAAKLSELREENYRSFITSYVYDTMAEDAKFGEPDKHLMWEKRTFQFVGATYTVYRSFWSWIP